MGEMPVLKKNNFFMKESDRQLGKEPFHFLLHKGWDQYREGRKCQELLGDERNLDETQRGVLMRANEAIRMGRLSVALNAFLVLAVGAGAVGIPHIINGSSDNDKTATSDNSTIEKIKDFELLVSRFIQRLPQNALEDKVGKERLIKYLAGVVRQFFFGTLDSDAETPSGEWFFSNGLSHYDYVTKKLYLSNSLASEVSDDTPGIRANELNAQAYDTYIAILTAAVVNKMPLFYGDNADSGVVDLATAGSLGECVTLVDINSDFVTMVERFLEDEKNSGIATPEELLRVLTLAVNAYFTFEEKMTGERMGDAKIEMMRGNRMIFRASQMLGGSTKIGKLVVTREVKDAAKGLLAAPQHIRYQALPMRKRGDVQ